VRCFEIYNSSLTVLSGQLASGDGRAGFNWWEAWGEIKIEGFGGRPPFGGRPNAK